MKIEFEIEESEAVLLLNILRRFMGQTNNPNVLGSLSKIASEIESDLNLGNETLVILKTRIRGYTNGNRIFPEADMRVYLGISNNFITRSGGLEREVNKTLALLIQRRKPNYDLRKIKKIPLSKVSPTRLISDVQELIQSTYESIE